LLVASIGINFIQDTRYLQAILPGFLFLTLVLFARVFLLAHFLHLLFRS
jgi:hypothetical protein